MKTPGTGQGRPGISPGNSTGPQFEADNPGRSLMDVLDAAMPGVSPGVFDAADFQAIAAIARDEAGIMLSAGKAMLVYSRLAPLVRTSNCATFPSYVMRIREDREELRNAIGALTACNPAFYRHAEQFGHFARHVRPGFVDRLLRGGRVRLWSAGCANGEEPWSLLLTLLGPDLDEGQAIARTDLRLLATDIAAHGLARARNAIYRAEELAALPEPLRCAWTIAHENGTSSIALPAQPLARFRALNLVGEWPMKWRFDAIFCRNVLTHFDAPLKEKLLPRLAGQLEPGGWLYLGISDDVAELAKEWLEPHGNAIYRKPAAAQ